MKAFKNCIAITLDGLTQLSQLANFFNPGYGLTRVSFFHNNLGPKTKMLVIVVRMFNKYCCLMSYNAELQGLNNFITPIFSNFNVRIR